MFPAAKKKINSHNLEGQDQGCPWTMASQSCPSQGWQTPCQGVCFLHGAPCEQGLLGQTLLARRMLSCICTTQWLSEWEWGDPNRKACLCPLNKGSAGTLTDLLDTSPPNLGIVVLGWLGALFVSELLLPSPLNLQRLLPSVCLELFLQWVFSSRNNWHNP